MSDALKLGVLGIDHAHIVNMLGNLLKQGCHCDHWHSAEPTSNDKEFTDTFPNLKKVSSPTQIIEDPNIDLILIAAIPNERAALAIAAMEAGKDVMVDKPGCTTLAQLNAIKDCVKRTGRIWTVNFSERFEVPAVVKAEELVAAGEIGSVIQTMGTGPHKQGLHQRPDWFYQRSCFGGILCDIGSHQIDQFLFFTGSTEVEISHALTENTSKPDQPGFQDFGEVVLKGDKGHGYIRVDWFTPEALPVWGDGRLTILGDKGYIELRKYINIGEEKNANANNMGNHLYLANGNRVEYIDCNEVELTYSPRLIADVKNRTETAVSQAHTFRTMEIALLAQQQADSNSP